MVNLKNRPQAGDPKRVHTSYGIQKWLYDKNFIRSTTYENRVDKEEYKKLLLEYFYWKNKISKESDNQYRGVTTLENFVQKNFQSFTVFCCNTYFKTNPIIELHRIKRLEREANTSFASLKPTKEDVVNFEPTKEQNKTVSEKKSIIQRIKGVLS